MDILRTLLFFIPIMFYYLAEAMFSAIFIRLAWRFVIEPTVNIEITYLQWVVIIWIFKVIFFDIFKLLGSFAIMPPPPEEQNDNQN
jgi:hypothetical protein